MFLGNVFAEGNFSESSIIEKTTFRENQLYIGQDISNIYVYTKFMAERIILENVANHTLKATIIRLGNITNRYSDGKFQINISENAFLSRVLAFIKLGCIPNYSAKDSRRRTKKRNKCSELHGATACFLLLTCYTEANC